MTNLIIIPARMASKRLPGKPLLDIGGTPLVVLTAQQASKVADAHVVVATPDIEIARVCNNHDIATMPTHEHDNGTQRCAEIAVKVKSDKGLQVVVNWQCDEPLVDPVAVEELIRQTGVGISTLVARTAIHEQYAAREDVVKVACNGGRCFWFSRAPLRGASLHVGVYAFKPEALYRAASIPASYFARQEGLEQLTWLENGFLIKGIETNWLPAVNTEEDLGALRRAIEVGAV